MTDFVLLHGTTQSAAGWERLGAALQAALQAAGRRSWTVELASSAELSAEAYGSEVRRQVPDTVQHPVVVAHSGAGLLLPAVARALGAHRQVWLAAAIPDPGRSFLEEVSAAPGRIFNDEWRGKDPTQDPVLATYFLFHDCDLATLRWALTTLRAFSPERAYREAVRLTPAIPSTYVVCSQDRTLKPDWSRPEAKRRLSADVVEIDAGHCPHVSRPAELAGLLGGLG
ncbi:MAG: alpha/beta hydrolase [Candidatus Dormiibacterota bacterium]